MQPAQGSHQSQLQTSVKRFTHQGWNVERYNLDGRTDRIALLAGLFDQFTGPLRKFAVPRIDLRTVHRCLNLVKLSKRNFLAGRAAQDLLEVAGQRLGSFERTDLAD